MPPGMIARPSNIALNFVGVFLALITHELGLAGWTVIIALIWFLYNLLSYIACKQGGM